MVASSVVYAIEDLKATAREERNWMTLKVEHISAQQRNAAVTNVVALDHLSSFHGDCAHLQSVPV